MAKSKAEDAVVEHGTMIGFSVLLFSVLRVMFPIINTWRRAKLKMPLLNMVP